MAGVCSEVAKFSRMETTTPSEAPTTNLPLFQVIAAGLLCGLLSFGCFYSTVKGRLESPQAATTHVSSEAPTLAASLDP